MPRHAALNGNARLPRNFQRARKAGILFSERHINVGRNTLNRYYLSYLSGLTARRYFTSGAERRASFIIRARYFWIYLFLHFYSADKRDRSRYSHSVGFDLQWDPPTCRGILIRSGAPADRYASNRRRNNWSSGDACKPHDSSIFLFINNDKNLFKCNDQICRD